MNSAQSLKIKLQFHLLFIGILVLSTHALSQTNISGKIIDASNGKPVASATLGINGNRFWQSDANGKFNIEIRGFKKTDSLIISSIGYETLKLSVSDAMSLTVFKLNETLKSLQPLVLKSYLNEETSGSKSEVSGYFRSWKKDKTGGEIGKEFYINHDDYKLERLRFKINNQCDTCLIKLHIRKIVDDLPAEEILYDSIAVEVHKLSFDDKFSEIDLRNYNLVLKERYILISLEVLYCSSIKGNECSLCFIGTETGKYLYKKRRQDDWEISDNDYSIYMRLFYKF